MVEGYLALWDHYRKNPSAQSADLKKAAAALLATYGHVPGDKARVDAMGADSDFISHLVRLIDPKARGQGNPEPTSIDDLPPLELEAWRQFAGDKKIPYPTFSEAKENYLRFHNNRDKAKFLGLIDCVTDLLISIAGDLPLNEYTREHTERLVAYLLEQGTATTSIDRYLTQIIAIFNNATQELSLDLRNPFAKPRIPNKGKDAKKRTQISLAEIQKVQEACKKLDDDKRWLIALASDNR